MKQTINGHEFEFYESINEMPISVFHAYSRYMLVVSGIGDSLQDIDEHIRQISNLMVVDIKKANQELLNLRQCLFMVATEQDIRHKGYLALTKTLDGKKWEDYSESGIDSLYAIANADTVKHVQETFVPIISGIDDELRRYFPDIFESSVDKNYTELLRKRALLQADSIINGTNHDAELEEVKKNLANYIRPNNFENEKTLIEFDKQFEEMCLILSKEFGNDIKGKSVMEFYSAYELLKKQHEELRKLNKK